MDWTLIARSEEQQRAYEERRRAQKREYARRRRAKDAKTAVNERAREAKRKRGTPPPKRSARSTPRLQHFQCVLLRRCPCGQVVNTNGSSQSSGWVTRREVSVQCCLQEMPLLPLPPANSQSVTTADDAEKGLSLPGDTRLSHVLSLFERGTDRGTGKDLKCQRLFRCHLCQYTTRRHDALRSHVVLHGTVQPYKCEVCPATYKNLQCYKAHMCKHTGEALYQCDLCPYSTSFKSGFWVHKKTHTNALPLACTMCAYRTKDHASLGRHKEKHRSNKPFKCKICSLGFGRKHYLNIHMQQHRVS